MRATRTPSSLKWLINKKARIEGEIKFIEAITPSRLERSKLAVEAAENTYLALLKSHKKRLRLVNDRLPTLQKQFEAIKATLGIHEIQINPDLIQPIRPQSRKRLLPYGVLTRDLYNYLRRSAGPATTKQIARYIMGKHVLDEEISLVRVTTLVGKRLRKLADEGKVIAMHQKLTNYEGVWKLPS